MINCPGHAGLADWECCKCSSHGAPVAGLCRALLGGFGVFYTPHVAALALILLGAVQAVSHFIRGAVKLHRYCAGAATLSGSRRRRPAPMNSTMKAATTQSRPDSMKAWR